MPMTDDEKLRFTTDLNTIRNAVKGKDVKDSIHDALSLVGKYSGEGYERIEYIQSTGTQYILTDIIPTYDMKVELDANFGSVGKRAGADYRWIFGIAGTRGMLAAVFFGSSTGNRDSVSVYDGFGYVSGMSDNVISNVLVAERKIMTVQRPQSSWGAQTCATNRTIDQPNPSIPIMIFGQNTHVGCFPLTERDMYLYSFKVYNGNNALLHDLIPVERQSDGELGLYDTITDKFYSNAGTGTFIKGDYI